MAPNKYAVGQDERTFLMIKPDGVQRGLVGEIIKRFEAKGWKLVGLKQMMVPRDLAEKHYGDLREKYFFEGLVQFITSGPVVAMVWQGHGIVKGARTLLGETNPVNSAPGTIRGDLSCDIGRNIVHGSDSTETAQDEISTWFPEGTITWRQADINWVYENELDLADYTQ